MNSNIISAKFPSKNGGTPPIHLPGKFNVIISAGQRGVPLSDIISERKLNTVFGDVPGGETNKNRKTHFKEHP